MGLWKGGTPSPTFRTSRRETTPLLRTAVGKPSSFTCKDIGEVMNDTDGWRVVLFVDFLRPLPFPVSVLNKAAIYAISRQKSVKDMRSYLENHQ